MNITLNNLKAVVDTINDAVGNKDPKAVGHYYIDNIYSGYRLAQITKNGECSKGLTTIRVSKRELYNQLFYFLAGIEAAQHELKQQINQLTIKPFKISDKQRAHLVDWVNKNYPRAIGGNHENV